MRGDGECNAACMNRPCGWDHGDCTRECAPGCTLEQLGNGVCEAECGGAECGYDAIDCSCTNVRTECDGAASDGSELRAHYNNNDRLCWLLQPSHIDARLTLRWERFDTEPDEDYVRVCDGSSELLATPLRPLVAPSRMMPASALANRLLITGACLRRQLEARLAAARR